MRFANVSLLVALVAAAPSREGEITWYSDHASLDVRDELKTTQKGASSSLRIMSRDEPKSSGEDHAGRLLMIRQSSDFCAGDGVTCQSCFGSGWEECADNVTCYNPNDVASSCNEPQATSSSSGTSSGGNVVSMEISGRITLSAMCIAVFIIAVPF